MNWKVFDAGFEWCKQKIKIKWHVCFKIPLKCNQIVLINLYSKYIIKRFLYECFDLLLNCVKWNVLGIYHALGAGHYTILCDNFQKKEEVLNDDMLSSILKWDSLLLIEHIQSSLFKGRYAKELMNTIKARGEPQLCHYVCKVYPHGHPHRCWPGCGTALGFPPGAGAVEFSHPLQESESEIMVPG